MESPNPWGPLTGLEAQSPMPEKGIKATEGATRERKESETTFIIKIRSLRSLKLLTKSIEVKNELSCESNWQIIDLEI